MSISIRLLGVSDVAAYRALRLQILQEQPEAFTSSYPEESRKDVSEDAKRLVADSSRPHDFFVGALDGETLVGVVGLKGAYRQNERHTATVIGMMVERSYRKRGVGKLLMQELLAQVRKLPELEQLVLTVTEGNATAQGLYARCGFVVYGIRPGAIQVDGRRYGKVHMLLELAAP